MSQLVSMRNRMRAIQTIKKVTHAMRLISMSSYTTLRRREGQVGQYTTHLATMFTRAQYLFPEWANPFLNRSPKQTQKNLLILIGSQKGLCGDFNGKIAQATKRYLPQDSGVSFEFALVGKQLANESVIKTVMKNRIFFEPQLSIRKIESMTEQLVSLILDAKIPYQSVTIIGNHFRSFFFQEPHILELFAPSPSLVIPSEASRMAIRDLYILDQEPSEILDVLAKMHVRSQIFYSLYQSLLAEHAARFASMDGATRNAQTILEQTKILFNKLRQAKITTEITEVSANF